MHWNSSIDGIESNAGVGRSDSGDRSTDVLVRLSSCMQDVPHQQKKTQREVLFENLQSQAVYNSLVIYLYVGMHDYCVR